MDVGGIKTYGNVIPYKGIREHAQNTQKKNVRNLEDKVELSNAGKRLNAMSNDFKINDDRQVQDIKRRLDSNMYNVDSIAVAESMIEYIRGREY